VARIAKVALHSWSRNAAIGVATVRARLPFPLFERSCQCRASSASPTNLEMRSSMTRGHRQVNGAPQCEWGDALPCSSRVNGACGSYLVLQLRSSLHHRRSRADALGRQSTLLGHISISVSCRIGTRFALRTNPKWQGSSSLRPTSHSWSRAEVGWFLYRFREKRRDQMRGRVSVRGAAKKLQSFGDAGIVVGLSTEGTIFALTDRRRFVRDHDGGRHSGSLLLGLLRRNS